MRLAVDFDGTIAEDKYPRFGKIKKGVKEALRKFKASGFYITIYSCRTGEELVPNRIKRNEQKKELQKFLLDNDIVFDEIYEGHGKPLAHYFIDDHNIEFKDNWEEIVERILMKDGNG